MTPRNRKLDMRFSTGRTAERERQLRRVLRGLVNASDELTSAIEGVTDQFDAEKGRLMDATSAAEKFLKGGAP